MASPNSAKRKPAKKTTKKKVEETALKAVRMELWDVAAVALIHQRLYDACHDTLDVTPAGDLSERTAALQLALDL